MPTSVIRAHVRLSHLKIINLLKNYWLIKGLNMVLVPITISTFFFGTISTFYFNPSKKFLQLLVTIKYSINIFGPYF